MQTAMQELIEKLKEKRDAITDNSVPNRRMKGAYVDAIVMAQTILFKERQQIIDARENGFTSEVLKCRPIISNEQYYSNNYGQALQK